MVSIGTRVGVCIRCGMPFVGPGSYCLKHAGPFPGAKRSQADKEVYGTYRWDKLRRTLIKEHVREYGWVCLGVPEEGHARHPATRLSLDHVRPLSSGGDPWDRGNLRVLCYAYNTRRGLKHAGGRPRVCRTGCVRRHVPR